MAAQAAAGGRRRRIAHLFIACLLLAARRALSSLTIARNTDDCVYPALSSAAGVNFYPNASYIIQGQQSRPGDGSIAVTSAALFEVRYYPTYKVVTNKWVPDGETYVLYQCGTPRPSNVPAGAKVFEIPLVSVSSDDTTAADFMKQVGMMDRIAFASELSVSNCLQAIVGCGYVAPDPHIEGSVAADIDSSVDAFFTYDKSTNPKSIAVSAPAGRTPLLRAEWLRYIAAFFNKEVEANALYGQVRNAYNALARAAASQAAKQGRRPVVLWVYLGWEGDFVVSKPPFKLAYIRDAGGATLDDATLASLSMTRKSNGNSWALPQTETDAWVRVLSKADVIIDESYDFANGGFISMEAMLAGHRLSPAQAAAVPAIANKNVYTLAGTTSQVVTRPGSPNVGTVGMDWFERGASRCDEVLRDFVKALHPSVRTVSTWRSKWLLRLDGVAQPVRISTLCTSPTAKLDAACKRVTYAARICPNAVRNCDTGVMAYPPIPQRCNAVSDQKTAVRRRRLAKQTPLCRTSP